MATASARGRPKGSGINDDKIIARISKLLAKDPGLKPTTAIKDAGINDPSSIRRLRDKLKSTSPSRKAPRRKSAAPRKSATVRKKTTAARTATTRKSPARAKSAKKKTVAKKTVTTRTAASSRKAPKRPVKKTVQTRKAPGKRGSGILDELGFHNPLSDLASEMVIPTDIAGLDMENLVSTTVEKQIQFYESALKFSPFANLLRQQALMTDMMLSILRTQKEITQPPGKKR